MEHRLIVSVPDEEIEDIIPTVSQILCSDSAARRFSRVTKTPERLKPVKHFVSDYQIIRMTLVKKVRWLKGPTHIINITRSGGFFSRKYEMTAQNLRLYENS